MHYPYLIIGGGMAADAAVRGIREMNPNASIGLVSAEPDAPYARPPLSKGLWKGDPLEKIDLHTQDAGATLHLARRITSLDVTKKVAQDQRGEQYHYTRLLLATGGTPRRLPYGGDDIIYYRTLQDYRRLRELADKKASVVVIGGGFIGSEIAAALTLNGCRVTMLFPETGIGSRLFPADLSRFLVDYYREKGVDVRTGASVRNVRRAGKKFDVETMGEPVRADAVVAGLGIQPTSELAEAAGLETQDGIVVNEHLQTSNPDVYAAGDVARFTAPALGTTMRVEHEDNSVTMGKAAGRAMAGDSTPYTHLPFFYSDLFDLGYEAVGELDPRTEIEAQWNVPFKEGVVHYKSRGRLRGVLLWNTWGQVDAAREQIAGSNA